MVTSKWLMRLTRHCSSWSIAQRQIQRTQTWVSQQTFAEYQQSLPIILDKGLADFNFSPELCDRLKKFTAYNVGSGKQIRGLLTMAACEALMQPEQNEELREKMYVLAWAAEMLHAFFLVTDDMEDGAKTRHGQTCWHLLPDVGKYAVTDTGMFRSFLSEILRVYFGKEAVYPKLVNIFNETYFKTHIGQFIDSTLCSNRQYLSFTTEQYALVSAYKTSFYTFQFPVLLGLALNNKYSDKAYKIVESIGSDVGLLLQMKNDYLDLYGDEIVEGKTGTDIQEGKCSLPAVTAVKLSNEHQKNIFFENYGRWEDKCVNEIRILYNDLQLKKICVDEEKKLYNSISKRINNLPKDSIPPAHLFAKVSTICKQSDILTNLNNEFPYYLPKIIKTSLTKKKYADNIEIKERIKNLSEYHTLAREPIQGRLTFLAFDALAESKDLTEEKLHQVQVLAWAVELIQSYFLIGDDMEDSSETRCGKPTWH
ncbi:PREDICTED: farnesyl pyrophosphate synthase-like [Papilio xuthus]|uniref:Farnesyl pyrophosphate synthase-like n=1 Tax=Papilio xuthus TaxID=66420 RepID=A0AAJ6Z1H8_PAPXU|nr:PREDICTED: farnesyl pyrophosphate synthase-like [Papilio xuthus]